MNPAFSRVTTRTLGRTECATTWRAMQAFTVARREDTPDEIWLTEHDPVYTLGLAGRREHLLRDNGIPVLAIDRGGQVTYHGPGQVVAYPLVDLRRLRLHVKEYVYRLEAAVLRVLEGYGITGHRVAGAPGVYVRLADPSGHALLAGPPDPHEPFRGLGKIAALGIKVTRGCAYHGVALNVDMDLEPFGRIDPCGYPGLATADLARLGVSTDWHDAAQRLAQRLAGQLEPR